MNCLFGDDCITSLVPRLSLRGGEPGNEAVYYLKRLLFFCSLAECQSSEQEKTAQSKALEVWCPLQC